MQSIATSLRLRRHRLSAFNDSVAGLECQRGRARRHSPTKAFGRPPKRIAPTEDSANRMSIEGGNRLYWYETRCRAGEIKADGDRSAWKMRLVLRRRGHEIQVQPAGLDRGRNGRLVMDNGPVGGEQAPDLRALRDSRRCADLASASRPLARDSGICAADRRAGRHVPNFGRMRLPSPSGRWEKLGSGWPSIVDGAAADARCRNAELDIAGDDGLVARH